MRRLGPFGQGLCDIVERKRERRIRAAAKGGGKGKGETDKGKGKGKGYQGTCWKCGKVGHKSAERRHTGPVDEEGYEEENEGEEIEVGTVWNIGAIEIAETNGQDEIMMDVGAIDVG